MKKLSLFAFSALLVFSAVNAFATCPTPPSGPYNVGYGPYMVYTQDQPCYTGTGSVTNTSIYCFYEPAWSFGSGNSYRQTSFTVGQNDIVENPNKWEIDTWIDFSSPGGTPSDNFEVDIDVQHPDWTVSRYTLLYWSGAYGSIDSCNGAKSRLFSANHGDVITITIRATNSGSANIVVSRPRLFNLS
jgi:hypothetical protein